MSWKSYIHTVKLFFYSRKSSQPCVFLLHTCANNNNMKTTTRRKTNNRKTTTHFLPSRCWWQCVLLYWDVFWLHWQVQVLLHWKTALIWNCRTCSWTTDLLKSRNTRLLLNGTLVFSTGSCQESCNQQKFICNPGLNCVSQWFDFRTSRISSCNPGRGEQSLTGLFKNSSDTLTSPARALWKCPFLICKAVKKKTTSRSKSFFQTHCTLV